MKRILVVDDEQSILELVRFNLEKAGYVVVTLTDGQKALQHIQENPPDLLVLDLMLPGQDGLEVCRQLRQRETTKLLPIIMLTARSEEIDRVVGLEIGADDYLTKPFSPRELVARVKSLLRRSQTTQYAKDEEKNVISLGNLVIYKEKFEAYLKGQALELTPKEFQLLAQMASYPGKVYTREFLLENIWGYDFAGDTRTVDVHIRHLRQKLETDSQAEMIETVRGVGYRLKAL